MLHYFMIDQPLDCHPAGRRTCTFGHEPKYVFIILGHLKVGGLKEMQYLQQIRKKGEGSVQERWHFNESRCTAAWYSGGGLLAYYIGLALIFCHLADLCHHGGVEHCRSAAFFITRKYILGPFAKLESELQVYSSTPALPATQMD